MPGLLSASERKRRRARANGAKSRGPITAAGKSRASRNAPTHGLRSARLVLGETPDGLQETYLGLVASLIASSAGEPSAAQCSLVAGMALAWHRLQQLLYMEVDTFRREMANFPNLSPLRSRKKHRYQTNLQGTQLRPHQQLPVILTTSKRPETRVRSPIRRSLPMNPLPHNRLSGSKVE